MRNRIKNFAKKCLDADAELSFFVTATLDNPREKTRSLFYHPIKKTTTTKNNLGDATTASPQQFPARSIRSVIHHNSDPPQPSTSEKSSNNRDKNNRPAGTLGTLLVTLTLDHARFERLLWIFAKLTFEHVCSLIWLAVSFM